MRVIGEPSNQTSHSRGPRSGPGDGRRARSAIVAATSWLACTWILFGLSLVVVLIALGRVTLAALHLDDAQRRLDELSGMEERVRLALWRMDSALALMVAEEDARTVMLLHCERDNGPRLREMQLAIPKNNNGATGRVRLNFNPECQRFEQAHQSITDDDVKP